MKKIFESYKDDRKATRLADAIDKSIIMIDDSLDYTDLAKAISIVFNDSYGKHLKKDFLKELNNLIK